MPTDHVSTGAIHSISSQRKGYFSIIEQNRVPVKCENGKLIIDIIHPRRELAALYIGPGEVSSGGGPAVWYKCIRICENTTFDECRQYAQSVCLLPL